MDSTPPPEGPRYATLMEQMAAWLTERLATHQPPATAERLVPPPKN